MAETTEIALGIRRMVVEAARRLKFQFDFTGVHYDRFATWKVRTVEIEGQWRHVGRETTRLYGIVRAGFVARGDLVAVPAKSDRVFLSVVVDFMISQDGDLDWDYQVGQTHHKVWLLLQGIPANQDLVCPAVAVGQDGLSIPGVDTE
jgi:hypothetical protein